MSRARGGRSFLAAAGEAAGLGGVDRDKGAAACVAACRDNQHSRQQTERYLATVLYCTVLYCHGSPAAGAGWYTGTSGFDTASSALRVAACLAYGVGWTHERCLLACFLAGLLLARSLGVCGHLCGCREWWSSVQQVPAASGVTRGSARLRRGE